MRYNLEHEDCIAHCRDPQLPLREMMRYNLELMIALDIKPVPDFH